MSENTEVTTEEAKAPTTKKKVVGVSRESKITVKVDSNPKREGSASYTRFQGYLTDPVPTTVEEALKKGLIMGDIHYDFIHGSIEVEGASIEEYTPTPRGPRKEKTEGSEEVVAEDEQVEGDNEIF